MTLLAAVERAVALWRVARSDKTLTVNLPRAGRCEFMMVEILHSVPLGVSIFKFAPAVLVNAPSSFAWGEVTDARRAILGAVPELSHHPERLVLEGVKRLVFDRGALEYTREVVRCDEAHARVLRTPRDRAGCFGHADSWRLEFEGVDKYAALYLLTEGRLWELLRLGKVRAALGDSIDS